MITHFLDDWNNTETIAKALCCDEWLYFTVVETRKKYVETGVTVHRISHIDLHQSSGKKIKCSVAVMEVTCPDCLLNLQMEKACS